MRQPWLNISFPERLFVMGAGPSLEILYEHRREANEWGDWAVMRSDLVQPLLEFIKPKYTIRYYSAIRHLNKTYGISLEEVHPDTNGDGDSGGSSLHEFIYQFQDHGGKELFLFGFDGDSSGHWRSGGKFLLPGMKQSKLPRMDGKSHPNRVPYTYKFKPSDVYIRRDSDGGHWVQKAIPLQGKDQSSENTLSFSERNISAESIMASNIYSEGKDEDNPHIQDCEHMNNCSSKISIKLFHIGKTRHKTMKQITIDELKGTYLNA